MEIWMIMSTVILALIVALAVVYWKVGKKRPIDYYNFFIIGLVWLPLGLVFNNPALWIMGLVFFAVGLVNKDKWKKNRQRWKDLTKAEKRLRIIIMIILGLLVLVGLFFFIYGAYI
jgi:hypothetical protein